MHRKSCSKHAIATLLIIQGCSSPLENYTSAYNPQLNIGERLLDDAMVADTDSTINLPSSKQTKVEKSLLHRMGELSIITPSGDSSDWSTAIGLNLHLDKATIAPLTMTDAVMFAIENNLDVKLASLQPEITKQSVISAEAAFDFVFGAGASSTRSRIPQQQIVLPGGTPLSSSETSTDRFSTNAELVKKLYGGGTITVSTNTNETKSEADGFTYSPDPAWQSIGAVELSQPLLRNFGETVTLAKIKLSEIAEGQAKEDFADSLNTVVSETEKAYLEIGLQWKSLQVKQWLLEEGMRIVEILEIRMDYDTAEADYAQAVATVQQRRADVISQQSIVHTSSDTLKQLINTSEYPVESEIVIQPTGALVANPVSISLRQALVTALERRPDLRKLAMSIESESINMQVADNAMLPQLDMQAQMSFYGLGDSASAGYDEVFDTDYINYVVGLTLRTPLGNRAAKAEYQSSRIQRMSATASYKRGIQRAILDVKKALRDIVTNEELIRANRSFRIAQTENLRALRVEEETMAGLTPTFLNLKLQTQSLLATARISEFSSIVNYNKAIVSLNRAMGTTLDPHQISIDEPVTTIQR